MDTESTEVDFEIMSPYVSKLQIHPIWKSIYIIDIIDM